MSEIVFFGCVLWQTCLSIVSLTLTFVFHVRLRFSKMAGATESSQLSDEINNLNVNENNSSLTPIESTLKQSDFEYGLPLLEVYKLALSFYKG